MSDGQMNQLFYLLIIAAVFLKVASIYDIKTREIPDGLCYSLMIIALTWRVFASLIYDNPGFIIQGLIGFGILYIIGMVLYKIRFFGGGDAKLIMALGLILPIFNNTISNLMVMVIFVLSLIVIGLIYIAIWFIITKPNKLKELDIPFAPAIAMALLITAICLI